MSIEEKINVALARAKISKSELARRLGTTPQNLHQRIKKGSLKDTDMQAIAQAIGCTWKSDFDFGKDE